jgi:putative ABC transport system permease protein
VRVRVILTNTLHGLRCARGTLALAFVILTLAMTASTVTFSIVDAVAFRPLPYTSPDELVGITTPGSRAGALIPITARDFFALQAGAQAFAAVAASRPAPPLKLGEGDTAETLITRSASVNLFDVLGVTPSAGRLFRQGDDRIGGARVAVLSHELWARRFGSNRSILGTTVAFGAEAVHIVGVLPAGVWHPMELNPPAIYIAYAATEAERTNARMRALAVVGRLRPGISIAQGRADVDRVVSMPVTVQPLQDQVVGSASRWLLLLLAAVTLILVIACVNVATLLLARATTRGNEFAIRASLGEPRQSVAAALLLEGLMLAFGAGGAAVILSAWGIEAATASLPPGMLTRVSTVAINGRVLAASIGIAACSAIVFGTAPAWLATRWNLMAVMKASGGPVIGGRRIERSLAAFLVSQVTVVCILVVAATLVVRSFIAITTMDLGFDRQNVATIDYQRAPAPGNNAARLIASTTLRNELLKQARTVRGVVDAAISMNASVPLSGTSVRYSLVIPGFGEALAEHMPETRMVTPEYFGVMGMQLVSGRLFGPDDRAGAPPVMLINDVAAQRFFPGRDAVGQVVTFRAATTIVGVLKSVRFEGPEGEVVPEMYIPADQERLAAPRDFGAVVIRTSGSPQQVAAAVREAIRPVLGAEPGSPQVVDDFFRRLTAGRRFNASIMSVLAVMAIALGIAGVYGTMQFVVTRQFRDIGLRLALGASRTRIMRSVLSVALRRVAIGLLAGLTSAWAISNAFQSLVFGITPTDPGTYFQVAIGIALIGVGAAFVPALRAARLDPVETLRRE